MRTASPSTPSTLFGADFLAQLERLRLVTRRARATGDRGGRRSRRRGTSVEFADHRSYNPGDDFRRLDWNLYGRLMKLFIKLYVEEVDLTLHVALDASKSMAFGTPPKFDLARRLTAAFAYIALADLDRVQIGLGLGDGWRGLGPLRGKRQIFRVFEFLNGAVAEGAMDVTRALEEQPPARGGVSVVISDFLTPTSAETAVVRLTGAGQRVVLIQVLSPTELDPEQYGDFTLVDGETGAPVDVTIGPRVVGAYRARLEALQNELDATCRRRGAVYVPVRSDDDVLDLMVRTLPAAMVLR